MTLSSMTLWTELEGLDYSIRHVSVGRRPGGGGRGETGSWSTRVLECGAGTPFVLMHGTGGHLEAFTRNLRALASQYRVIAYDFPGHGWTTTTTHDLEIDDYVDHLTALLDELGIARAGAWGGGRGEG
ncbi:MAG TPA: alpha/beta fold hydrolase, partial [Trebonia sp.]